MGKTLILVFVLAIILIHILSWWSVYGWNSDNYRRYWDRYYPSSRYQYEQYDRYYPYGRPLQNNRYPQHGYHCRDGYGYGYECYDSYGYYDKYPGNYDRYPSQYDKYRHYDRYYDRYDHQYPYYPYRDYYPHGWSRRAVVASESSKES